MESLSWALVHDLSLVSQQINESLIHNHVHHLERKIRCTRRFHCAAQPETGMSTISNESIIAIVSLVATCPPSLVLIWHLLRRKSRVQRDFSGSLIRLNGHCSSLIAH